MTSTKINVFKGIRPRIPESLLAEGEATVAVNCDFAYGELRNTKDGFSVGVMSNAPQSIYTDDGLTFYTWTKDVDAVRSPLANDSFNRLYYTDGSAMKVTSRIGTRLAGGEPGACYTVGVPRPMVAPALQVNIPNITDGTKFSLEFKFHWEYAGIKYQEQSVSPTLLSPTQVSFTPPTQTRQVGYASQSDFPATGESGVVYKANDTGVLYLWDGFAYGTTSVGATPASAFPVLRMTVIAKADGSQFCDVYSENSSFQSSGGLWSIALSKDSNGNSYTATLTVGIKEADKEARAYIYTYVNTYGEEGPPSSPAIVTTSPEADVVVSATRDNLTGYAPIKEIRLYRTPTGSSIADYFYVGSISVLSIEGDTFSFTDSVKAEQLNEPVSSTYYYPPPTGLMGLMSLPNGILCAWKGSDLWFSEAYKPWAWNPSNIKTLNATIVGGIPHGSGAVITTVKQPYVVSGVSPDSMTTSRLNVDQAGVSKWSIAVVDGYVLYASNDGLVTIHGGSASLLQSQRFFTREVWRQRYAPGLSGMRFSVWDGRLVAFHASGAFTPFMIRTDEADGSMTDLPSLQASCAFISQLSDQFYYARGTSIYQFNGGSDIGATWQSRELVLQRPINYGAAQAVCEGSWTLELWAYVGGAYVLKHTQALTGGVTTFRLPSGYESDRYRIKLAGSGRFREFRIAKTGRGLAEI